MSKRASGILLHITSVPSPYGVGDFGMGARRFVDFLAESKQTLWQILPLNVTSPVFGNSPYSSPSAFAGNPLLISPDLLIEAGFLSKADIHPIPGFPSDRADYEGAARYKLRLFQRAYENFEATAAPPDFEQFCLENSFWLDDYALFAVLKRRFQTAWSEWDADIRDRAPDTIRELSGRYRAEIRMEKFLQYLFFSQWGALRSYCNNRGVKIVGDVPIYVGGDSADVWASPGIFNLDEAGRPVTVAGVPPDYFSKTGQRWGNPVYRWDALRGGGYEWWMRRMGHNFGLFDIVRLDHFRGFVGYWEIPAEEETAIAGRWREAPARDFFDALAARFGSPAIIAEDLGVITPDVVEIIEEFRFPTMKLLIFGFGGDFPRSPYLPHHYSKNCAVYTGTHDNNTVRGWWESESTPEERGRFCIYSRSRAAAESAHWEFIRLAMASVADYAIVPMQDILGLGGSSRMNLPATVRGNWEWRFLPHQITRSITERLRELVETYDRWSEPSDNTI
ncbi:MAG: 4-alpha-glucanotransferase [Deltaproteobacteria bacterium]